MKKAMTTTTIRDPGFFWTVKSRIERQDGAIEGNVKTLIGAKKGEFAIRAVFRWANREWSFSA